MNLSNNKYIKPYMARNMMIKKTETTAEPPTNNRVNETEPSENETGYITVGVYTASRALPVPNAVVTVFTTDNNGEENILYHLVTDESGRVPKMELPVKSGQQSETYNLRVQAIGYNTVNVMDLCVFPNITTNYTINLIPVKYGETPEAQGQTFVIPPVAAETSNR